MEQDKLHIRFIKTLASVQVCFKTLLTGKIDFDKEKAEDVKGRSTSFIRWTTGSGYMFFSLRIRIS